ncbi:DUF1778 domain-containing protein [Sphingobium sp. BYY-5]|uniref:type II toxin -antitoxin system TacA 1-like antitoxin n=1 Tax=Sphingobium sp. BYY-5 TaxID=2926400 RepID=UPI001FA8106A|nr:DUF1778 domain-containing protein [Sphingobium sp. BYY-5]MCI4592602.1 DUF1778 domain-containing protein [Sphingobium sp. BYY-5]
MARQARSDRSASAHKDDVIQIRAVAEFKAILDQHTFILDAEKHEQFLAALDAQPVPSAQLEKLMKREPLWNR